MKEWFEIVRKEGCMLQFVPEEFKDKKLCLEAVKNDGYVLKHVPTHLRDEEVCLQAVKKICLNALKDYGYVMVYISDGCVLEFIPEELRNENESKDYCRWPLQFIPISNQDRERLMKASVNMDRFIPKFLFNQPQIYLKVVYYLIFEHNTD